VQQLQSLLDNWRWFMEGDASFATMERVNWVELDAQHLYYELRSTPLAINTLLQENLWEQRQAVLTSATLAVENRLDFARQQLGLTDKKLCNALVLPSPFNYKEQSLLYLPPAGADTVLDDAYLEQVGEHLIGLLEATQGRALVLFTSYERMNGVAQYLMPRLDYPMRLQGDMSRSRLVEWFKRTPNAVLLATASFWEGVDIPGEALSCVVIEKLPFFPPDDPVHQTQIERLKASGQDWFNRFVLPQAILRLKQGIGRLIRKQDDRGVIALLDPRLHSKAYGRKVLASLPPMRRVSTFGEVQGFFG
jgi:ATP-dependent DNA helicase DinG